MRKHVGDTQPPIHRAQNSIRAHVTLDRMILYVLALALLLVPVLKWPGLYDPFVGRNVILSIALAVLSILWAISLLRSPKRTILVPSILAAFALFALAGMLSWIHAVNGREVLRGILAIIAGAQIVVMIANRAKTSRDVRFLLYALLLGATISAFIALLQYFGLVGGVRLSSTLGNRNYLGALLAYTFLPAAGLLVKEQRIASRILTGAALLLLCTVMILIDQMGILLGLFAAGFAGIGLLLLSRSRHRGSLLRPIVVFAGVILVSLAAVVALNWHLIQRRDPPQVEVVDDHRSPEAAGLARRVTEVVEAHSLEARLLFSAVALRMFAERPFTGIGLGNFRIQYMQYEELVRLSAPDDAYAGVVTRTEIVHNDYLQLAAELGVGGILAVLLFFTLLARKALAHTRREAAPGDQRLQFILIVCGLIVLLVHGLVSFPLHLPSSALVGTTLLGLLFSPAFGTAGTAQKALPRLSTRIVVVVLISLGCLWATYAATSVVGRMLYERASIELSRGERASAVETLSRSIRLSLTPRCAVYYLAIAQAHTGDFHGSLASFERSLVCCTSENTYLFYADLASQLGQIEPARRAIQILLGTNPPRDMLIQGQLVQAQIEHRAGDIQQAASLLQQLVASNPGHWGARIALGDALRDLEMYPEARDQYNGALRLIDRRISDIDQRAAATSTITVEEAAQLRGLRTDRARAEDALRRLPYTP